MRMRNGVFLTGDLPPGKIGRFAKRVACGVCGLAKRRLGKRNGRKNWKGAFSVCTVQSSVGSNCTVCRI